MINLIKSKGNIFQNNGKNGNKIKKCLVVTL